MQARLHGAETDLRGLQCKLQQQQAVLSELVKQEEQHGALCAERDDSLIVVQQLQKEFSCAQDAVEQERRVLREIEARLCSKLASMYQSDWLGRCLVICAAMSGSPVVLIAQWPCQLCRA